jgi:outer membrane protein assembly factor BamB
MPSPVRSWFSGGLLVCGAAVLLRAAWAACRSGDGHPWSAYTVLALLAVVGAGAALRRFRSAPGPVNAVPPRLLLASVGVVVALLSVPAWTAVIGVVREPTARFVDFTAWGLALGTTLVAIALVLPAPVSDRPRPGRPRDRRWPAPVAGLTGLAAGAGAVAAVFVAVELRPVDATTGQALAPDPAPRPGAADASGVPSGVSGVGWRWEVPDGQAVVDTVVAGGGAAVLHLDGVTLLDTRTGEERWRYRRADAHATDIAAAPDGSALVVAFSAKDHAGGSELRLVALDAATGRVRSEHRSPDVDFRDASPALPESFAVTADTFLVEDEDSDGDGRSFTAFGLDSGERAWRFAAPEGCVLNGWTPYAALRGEVVALAQCGLTAADAEDPDRDPLDHGLLLLGLDPADGSELWRHEEAVTALPYWVRAQASGDGGVFALEWQTGDGEGTRENVFVRPGGGVAARDHADLRAIPTWEGGDTLTGDGFLTGDESRSGDQRYDRYTLRPFEGEERSASVGHVRSFKAGALALEDQLIVLRSLYREDEPPYTNEPLLVLSQPWGAAEGEEPERLEIDLARDSENFGYLVHAHDHASLYPAPGAVVVARPDALEVVGLQ